MKKILIALVLFSLMALAVYYNLRPAKALVEHQAQTVKESKKEIKKIRQTVQKINADHKDQKKQLQGLMP